MTDSTFLEAIKILSTAQQQPELYWGLTSGQWVTTIAQITILVITVWVMWKGRNGAVEAVVLGRKLSEAEAKRQVFATIYAYRGQNVNYNLVAALNQIEIVFYDEPKVLTAWRELHAVFNRYTKDEFNSIPEDKKITLNNELASLRLELLIQMSAALKYSLSQKDLSKPSYSPIAHGYDEDIQRELQIAALEYFISGKPAMDLSSKFYQQYLIKEPNSSIQTPPKNTGSKKG